MVIASRFVTTEPPPTSSVPVAAPQFTMLMFVAKSVAVSESANPNQDPVSDRIKAFLTIVVRNKAIDLLRKDSRIAAEAPTDQQLGITAPADGTDVEQTIASLPAQYRDILINFYYVGLNAKEIAQQEGVHQHTILRRLKKAEQLFKEEYLRDR